MGLVTSLILLLVLAYALHMVVHLKHIDRYEEHKATVYFPRSPEAELPDKNSLWRKEEELEDERGREGERKLRSKTEGRAGEYKSEKVSSTEYLFNKNSTLPVHMKTLYVLTTLSKCRPWMDTFSSFVIDLHLGLQSLNKAFGCPSLSLRDGSWS